MELNRIFGPKYGRPDTECYALERFAVAVIRGAGFPVTHRYDRENKLQRDLNAFDAAFKISTARWNQLFDKHKLNGKVPIFRNHKGCLQRKWVPMDSLVFFSTQESGSQR